MRHLAVALSCTLTVPAAGAAQTLPAAAAVARVADSLGAAFVAHHRSPSVAIAVVMLHQGGGTFQGLRK